MYSYICRICHLNVLDRMYILACTILLSVCFVNRNNFNYFIILEGIVPEAQEGKR